MVIPELVAHFRPDPEPRDRLELDPPRGLRAALLRRGGHEFAIFDSPSSRAIVPGPSAAVEALLEDLAAPGAVPVEPGSDQPRAARGAARGRGCFDAIGAIEACYASEPGDAWLGGILAALEPLDRGLGRFARLEGTEAEWPARVVIAGPLDAAMLEDARAELLRAVGAEAVRALARPVQAVQLLSAHLRALPGELAARTREILDAYGLEDCLTVSGGPCGGAGAVLGIVVRRGFKPPSRSVNVLRHLAAHLGAACALRAVVPTGAPAPARAGPRGRRPSVARLALAVLERSGCCGLDWVDPVEAAGLWSALGRGVWSHVDHWEAEGRRVVFTRRNQLGRNDPRALRPRERAALAAAVRGLTNEAIADLLGIAVPTVVSHLASGRRKVGASSRRELAEVFGDRPWSADPAGVPRARRRELAVALPEDGR